MLHFMYKRAYYVLNMMFYDAVSGGETANRKSLVAAKLNRVCRNKPFTALIPTLSYIISAS